MEWYEIIKRVRTQKGISLRSTEVATGILNPYLCQLENGKIKNPSFFKMLILLDFLGIDIRMLPAPKEG